LSRATQPHTTFRWENAHAAERKDQLAVEEPLEIRVAGDTVAITMRTPGQDERLTAGFLLSEGIIESLRDVSRIFHCGRPGTDEFENTIDVLPAAGHTLDVSGIEHSRRGTLTTSACGVCGRQTIEDLLERCQVFGEVAPISAELVSASVGRLRDHQPAFDKTGGLHGVAVFDESGQVLAAAEDIGRHNAVDKVVGQLLYDGNKTPLLLAVSGRASFEMVQKAATARIPFVASVSAASTLAVKLADQIGITLAGFVRGPAFNIYTHPGRILQP